MLTFSMGRSPAWRSLGGAALKVFVELRCHYNGNNNGELFLSFADAARRLHLSKSTVARAFRELQDKGFIRKTRDGVFERKAASTWAVTDQPLREGEPAPNDWRRWQPDNRELGTAAAREEANRAAAVPTTDTGSP